MVELLTRPRGRALSAGRLFGCDRSPTRPQDPRELVARQCIQEVEHYGLPAAVATGRYIVGMAMPFGGTSTPTPCAADGVWRRARFSRTAFSDSFARMRAGHELVSLQLAHNDSRTIGQTESEHGKFLWLGETDRGIVLVIDAETRRGQLVAHLLRSRPGERELSIGYLDEEFADRRLADGTTLRETTRATLIEVSIVDRGAFCGTWIC